MVEEYTCFPFLRLCACAPVCPCVGIGGISFWTSVIIRVGRRSRRRPDFRSPYTQQFNEGACGITHMLTQVLLNFLCFSQRVG